MKPMGAWIFAGTIVLVVVVGIIIHYIFTIYEVTYDTVPDRLHANGQSIAKVNVIPLNAFGLRAPFRDAPAEFSIIEGKDYIDIISIDQKKSTLVVRATERPGKVIIKVKAKHSFRPSLVEIQIDK